MFSFFFCYTLPKTYHWLDTALCGEFIILNINLEVWEVMVLRMERTLVFLKGANIHSHDIFWLTGDICPHILPEKDIEMLFKQHISPLYNLKHGNF